MYLSHVNYLKDVELDSGAQLVLGGGGSVLSFGRGSGVLGPSSLFLYRHVSRHLFKLGKVLVHTLLKTFTTMTLTCRLIESTHCSMYLQSQLFPCVPQVCQPTTVVY